MSLFRNGGFMANLFQQFQLQKCRYASRGCSTAVRHEALSSHHEECAFAPVQCSLEGCEGTVNRQDLVSHQQSCEFRPINCEECHVKHPCVLRKKVDKNRQGLAEVQKILKEIQEEQLRQGEEMRQMARELRQPSGMRAQQGDNIRQQTNESRQTGGMESESRQPISTQRETVAIGTVSISRPIQNQATVNKQIVVAGGVGHYRRSYEVFDWSTQKWTVYADALFYDHTNGVSFVYNNKVMICGGTDTNRMEYLDITNNSSTTYAFPSLLPSGYYGKGVLCGDQILTFGQSVMATSLKPPYRTRALVPKGNQTSQDQQIFPLSGYGAARVNDSVVVIGGYTGSLCMWNEIREHVLLYNLKTRQIQKLPPLPYKLANMAVVVYNDNLIIVGAGSGKDVFMYNVTNHHCRKLPNMLEERPSCAAVIMGDTIVAVGGHRYGSGRRRDLKSAEYLTKGEDTWKRLPAMHYERGRATACVVP